MINLKLFQSGFKGYQAIRQMYIFGQHNCLKDDIYHSNLYKDVCKPSTQDSCEIINLSNDCQSINIPQSDNCELSNFYFENDTLEAALGNHGNIDLSSNMHANLPQPPNEAMDNHERPYDSIMSLGEGFIRNDKFLSEELVNIHQTDTISDSLDSAVDENKLLLYCSNEKRFGIVFSGGASELISQGLLDVDAGLDYQLKVMRDVHEFWTDGRDDVARAISCAELFFPMASPDTSLDRESFLKLYRLLDIDGTVDDIAQLQADNASYSMLIEKAESAIRQIVNEYFSKVNDIPLV